MCKQQEECSQMTLFVLFVALRLVISATLSVTDANTRALKKRKNIPNGWETSVSCDPPAVTSGAGGGGGDSREEHSFPPTH